MTEGDEEPMPITGVEIGAAARFAGWFRRTILRRQDPVSVLKRRAAVKDELREGLHWPGGDEVPEVMIVQLTKADRYGELDDRIIGRGASDWFKGEVKGLHDRGLEIFSAIEYIEIGKGKAYRVHPDESPTARKVWVVGRIPYERIGYIEWERDPNYSAPRLYVAYGWRREPFREIALYEGDPSDYLYELPELDYRGEGGGPFKRLGRLLHRIRFNLQLRRQAREARDQRYSEKR